MRKHLSFLLLYDEPLSIAPCSSSHVSLLSSPQLALFLQRVIFLTCFLSEGCFYTLIRVSDLALRGYGLLFLPGS